MENSPQKGLYRLFSGAVFLSKKDLFFGRDRRSFGKTQFECKMKIEAIKARVDELLALGENAANSVSSNSYGPSFVDGTALSVFRTASLSFISSVFGEEHTFFREFEATTDYKIDAAYTTARGQGIIRAIKQEIEGGWLFTVKGIVASEIFTDFLEMASYLLAEGYKDPAAVMIGGVLEEHLRQLCARNGVDSTVSKDGREVPKSADRMNSDLASAGVYSKLYQKGVTSWLDLRNKAAHGLYSEYDKNQVQLMEQSVLDFITKTS